jgi:RNA polymerase sigma factor (sigma-70 family)
LEAALTIQPSRTRDSYRPYLNSDSSDEQLMLAYAKGDAQAFEIVFERHRSWLLRTLRGSVRAAGLSGDELAEDIAQETWLTIIRTIDDYTASARFTTWLYQVAQHRLIDHLRKLGTSVKHTDVMTEEDSLSDPQVQADLSFDPARIVEHKAMMAQFTKALETLPTAQSEVFILIAQAGMTVPEVAQSLQLPLETVKSRLRYARSKLVEMLEGLRA